MRRRVVSALTAVALVAGMMSLTGVVSAGACEQQIQLPGTARGYDAGDGGRVLDGFVTNDTTQTLVPGEVKIGWLEAPNRYRETWVCSGPLAPGEWATFSMDWPCGIPTTWTPVVKGYASPVDSDAQSLPLTVTDVSEPTTDDAGVRTYQVTVSNPNAFPVSSIDVNALEKDAGSGDFVDALGACDLPDSIAAGGTEQIQLEGSSPWDGALTTDIHVTALEQPTLSLSDDTLAPAYGSPVTFQLALTHTDGTPATGCRTLKLFRSADGDEWDECAYRAFDTETGNVTAVAFPDRPTYFKAAYCGDDDLGAAESAVLFVQPQLASGAPVAPNHVRARRSFKVSGRMCAGAKSDGKAVTITVERKRGSRWLKNGSAKAAADSYGRYSKSLKLSSAGTYRIRAYRSGVGYSSYKSLKVTK